MEKPVSDSAARRTGDSPAFRAATVTSVAETIARMEEIEAALPDSDGVQWFNRLYLLVTRNVARRIADQPADWRSLPWITRVVPTFANLYFEALTSYETGRPTPNAWEPVFQLRHQPRIYRLQFALAGMSAHINRDLPYALQATLDGLGVPPDASADHPALAAVRHDYLLVNDILAASEVQARTDPSVGLIADLPLQPNPDLTPLADVLAMWSVRKAREVAWRNARMLRTSPGAGELLMQGWDSLTGAFNRGLLVRLKP